MQEGSLERVATLSAAALLPSSASFFFRRFLEIQTKLGGIQTHSYSILQQVRDVGQLAMAVNTRGTTLTTSPLNNQKVYYIAV